LLNVMKQLLSDQKKRYDGSESSWTSARGPAPGVRWRGGQLRRLSHGSTNRMT
jgi:hypothetical protein